MSTVGRPARDTVAAGGDDGRPRAEVDERARPPPAHRSVDVGGVEVVEVDGFAAATGRQRRPDAPSACSASTRLGLTRSAPAAAASISRVAGDVDGDGATAFVDQLDQSAVGAVGERRAERCH